MKLSVNFLQDNNILQQPFVNSNGTQRFEFFKALMDLASNDLSLAHATFKTSAARTILCLADHKKSADLFVAGFSVPKSFDTTVVSNNTVSGRKHWITNLAQSEFGILQFNENNVIKLYYVNLDDSSSCKYDFNFLKAPGLEDTCTGDVTFTDHPVEYLFDKTDSRYFTSSNHNSLGFIANYLGAVHGLFRYFDNSQLKAKYRSLLDQFTYEIKISDTATASDNFWHTRNALYLNVKQLMVDTCSFIVSSIAGNFYNLNSVQGQHFYDCLLYSGHNGPIARSYNELYTEFQDY